MGKKWTEVMTVTWRIAFCQYILGGGNCGGGYRGGKGRSMASEAFGGREESLRILFKE